MVLCFLKSIHHDEPLFKTNGCPVTHVDQKIGLGKLNFPLGK